MKKSLICAFDYPFYILRSGSNIFLREQYDAVAKTIRSNEWEIEEQREGIKQAANRTARLEAKLSAEKFRNCELIASLERMKAERDKLTTTWSIIRNEI